MTDYAQPSIESLAYDLRQRYAKIVGDQLELITDYRHIKDYSNYYLSLEDLYTIVKHKLTEDKKKKGDKKEVVNYDTLKQTCIDVSTENSDVWLGNSQESEEVAKVEKALRDIEMYLYAKMDEGNMFGSKRQAEHLS